MSCTVFANIKVIATQSMFCKQVLHSHKLMLQIFMYIKHFQIVNILTRIRLIFKTHKPVLQAKVGSQTDEDGTTRVSIPLWLAGSQCK